MISSTVKNPVKKITSAKKDVGILKGIIPSVINIKKR